MVSTGPKYGNDINVQYAGAAGYVARVARGEDPAEMPIQQPTKFEFVLNSPLTKSVLDERGLV